jgi:peptidoglycan hydrolase CwlO-like protein
LNKSFHKETDPAELEKIIEAKDREIEKLRQDLRNAEKENKKLVESIKQLQIKH